MRYIYVILPGAALILAIGVMWGFRLTRQEQERLRSLLDAREQSAG